MTDYNSNEEKILITNAKGGDENSFRQLVEKYQDQVARVVIGMLGNSDNARDVGQEVFIRFYRSMDQFKGESTLGTYLTKIAINLSLNELKKIKIAQLRIVGNIDSINDIEDLNQRQDKNEIKEFVQQAILKLEPDFRIVVVLRLIEGYSTKEVSEMLGIPLGTVLSRLARGQEKLKIILMPKM